MNASERANDYANDVHAEMVKAFRRKNRMVFAALYTMHQQALATYYVLAERANQEKQQRWRKAA